MAIDKGHIDAMYNLAVLYKDQNKYELAEKYYLMAIDKGQVNAMYNLAILYKKQDKYKLTVKYYLMAALHYDINARNKINEMLDKNFDIRLAIKAESFLNEKNTQKMNYILVYFYENQKTNFNGRLVENMDCVDCQKLSTVLFLKCCHPICIECFNNKNLCKICR